MNQLSKQTARQTGRRSNGYSRNKKFRSVRDMLFSLPLWDGTRRLGDWLSDYLHVDKTEYTTLVGTYFIRAMVRRALEPGCRFEYCLVLEGAQGCAKTRLAKTIASGYKYARHCVEAVMFFQFR